MAHQGERSSWILIIEKYIARRNRKNPDKSKLKVQQKHFSDNRQKA